MDLASIAYAEDQDPRAVTVRGADTATKTRAGETAKRDKVRALLNRALADFKLSAEAESSGREEMLEDERFRASDMWPADIKEARTAKSKPCLTIDQISGPIKQVTGEERQAKPSIHLSPAGEGADADSAEAREGLARAIQADSNAEIAYDWAFEKAVTIGLGWFRFYTEFEDDDSFDQVLKIGWIENTFCVYTDPTYQMPDRRDMRFALIKSWIPLADFARKHGAEKAKSLEEYSSTGDADPEWFSTEEGCAVAEYFYVDYEPLTLAQLKDGTVINVTGGVPAAVAHLVDDTREVQKRVVKWCLISATDILEGNEDLTEGRVWPSKYIPLVAVEGERLNVDGKRILRGIIRTARDPQMMYNVLVSTGMEALALTPKAAYVAAAGQIAQYKELWDNANSESYSALPYDPVEVGGVLAPPPQRQQAEPPIQAIFASIRQASQDLHTVTGFYDATDPNRPNSEQSGKAIDGRRQQGATAHVNLMDNLQRSLTYGGEIMIDMLPRVYDRPGRVLRLLGMDDSPSLVKLGPVEAPPQPGLVSRAVGGVVGGLKSLGQSLMGQSAPPNAAKAPKPMKVIDLRAKGRYAVRATVGASFTTRRQEVVAQLTELFKAYPPLAVAGMDILIANMDGPGMKQLAERVKRQLPPELRDETGDDEEPIPAHAQAQLAQQDQAIQFLSENLQKAVETIKTKQLELNSREKIEMMRTQSQVAMTMAKLGSEADRSHLDREFQRFTQQVDILHQQIMADANAQQAEATSMAAQTHEAGMAGADAAHQASMAAAKPAPATVGAAG